MMRLKNAVRALPLCALLLMPAPYVHAAETPTVAREARSLNGHYYLEGGPTETGSELLLKDDMQFEWALMVGAQDFLAKGRYELNGDRLVLKPVRTAPEFKLFDEDDYGRTRPAEPGNWIAVVGIPNVGPVQDIQVRFEARSGKTADAVSKPNGDAIVRMPAGETWVRAGLRGDDKQPWQWFAIPAGRAEKCLVGFDLTNVESVQSVPFEALTLLVGSKGLVIADEQVRLHGTYVKH